MDRATVVSERERRVPPGQQTANLRREQAFAEEGRWIGFVRGEPGEWSGWHHHGEQDTYFYMLRGQLEFEYAGGEPGTKMAQGDFVHLPAGVVHRERTEAGEPSQIVLVRTGPGPAVVNVDPPNR
jgi:quercetin dioxygenase-like cupin family protein